MSTYLGIDIAKKTFDAALRLLDDMRAGKARKPFKVIRGGKAD